MDSETAKRTDRVALFRQGWEAKVPFPAGGTWGDLTLDSNGIVSFSPVRRFAQPWVTPLSGITAVRPVSMAAAMRCYQAQAPKRLLDATIAGTRYFIFFSGVTRFLSGPEKLVSHVPGIHHAGALLVAVKSSVNNRGAKGRGIAARDMWFQILSGTMTIPDAVTPIEAAQGSWTE
jgi:hypothetical protein